MDVRNSPDPQQNKIRHPKGKRQNRMTGKKAVIERKDGNMGVLGGSKKKRDNMPVTFVHRTS